MRYHFQAPSLFGLENYGARNETRAMGYAWGELDKSGTIRVWPLRRVTQGGRQVFDWDNEFPREPSGCRIRPLTAPLPVATTPTIDLTPWLTALLDRTSHIGIAGIGSGVGKTKDASRYPIEQLYTTLRSRGEVEGRGGGNGVADLLSRHHLLLIEGQPGAGKTTFLRLVATMLARDIVGPPCPGGASWRVRYLNLDGRARPRVPLFLKLSELALLLAENHLAQGDDRNRLLDLLATTAAADKDEAWRAHWRGLLERGEAILLLDGLDEVAEDALRERVFAIFRDACTGWKNSPIVVTSRPFGAEAVRKMGFHHAVIEPFGREEITKFIQRWVAALHNLSINTPQTGEAAGKSEQIIATILSRPAILRLATNPVMLTCLCVVHWNEGDLPEGRARLYRAVIRWLIGARSKLRIDERFTDRFALEAFAALALAMMSGNKGGKVALIDLETAAEAVRPLVERHFPQETALPRARQWIRFECLYSGIIEERYGGRIGYWHLTFQEYLAAQALAWLGDGEEEGKDWWPDVRGRLDDLQWRETTELLPGALFDEGGGRRVDTLLERVLGLRGSAPTLADEARVFGILGRLLETMFAYGYKPKPEIEGALLDLQGRILPIFTVEGAAKVPAEVRIAAAEALGRGGDPRLSGDTFIEVPGTGGVKLSKYLVTVEEFLGFIVASGYDEPRYWSDEGWTFRQKLELTEPRRWDEQSQHSNRPVTGVSWYEADAYCRWRSVHSGRTIRLPTGKEWVAAARPDGRKYPWGAEEPTPELANYGENVGAPTPVGVYPAGNGPSGHCDLAGNVLEWSGDRDGDMHALRGGSWVNSPVYLRAAFRNRRYAMSRRGDVGFRVAAAPTPPPAGA
ncbi:MAG: SUMF1/EgtB/PvdO family nonheme iron enzyme [Alphaproteobacteria bacterium]